VQRARRLSRVVVATSTEPADDSVATLCAERAVACYRGSLNDVLARFCGAAAAYAPQHVVRLTADCPLVDSEVIDDTIAHHLEGGYDYTCNCLPPSFPDGLDVEVMRYSALQRAAAEATLTSQREHVTPYFYNNPQLFSLGVWRNHTDLSALRWTVDEATDLALVRRIYAELYPGNPAFGLREVLALLEEHPELKTCNTAHSRNQGYAESLLADQIVQGHSDP
jgi:spore coat polysaccharide biosynthesis protein SpsF